MSGAIHGCRPPRRWVDCNPSADFRVQRTTLLSPRGEDTPGVLPHPHGCGGLVHPLDGTSFSPIRGSSPQSPHPGPGSNSDHLLCLIPMPCARRPYTPRREPRPTKHQAAPSASRFHLPAEPSWSSNCHLCRHLTRPPSGGASAIFNAGGRHRCCY